MLKQKWTNQQNASDPSTTTDDADELNTAADSDATAEEGSSGSEEKKETEPKSILEGVLTAARPWSTNGRWKKILKEASVEKVHKMVQNSKDPR